MTKEKFLAKNPYVLERMGDYIFYEHPDYGDEAPIYMLTPSGNLVNTIGIEVKFKIDYVNT